MKTWATQFLKQEAAVTAIEYAFIGTAMAFILYRIAEDPNSGVYELLREAYRAMNNIICPGCGQT